MAEFPTPYPPGTFVERRTADLHEWGVPGVLAIMVTVMVAFATLTPYLIVIPESNLNLITQAQTTLWNGWLVILGFYFATTQTQGRKDAAIQALAQTAQRATGGDAASIALAPGQSAVATAGIDGSTEIKKDPQS